MVLAFCMRGCCKGKDALFIAGTPCGIAIPPHTSFIVATHGCAVTRREEEEPGATPGRPGNGAGDGGEARIDGALPVEAIARDGDGVALALIVANQHRAGFEPPPG